MPEFEVPMSGAGPYFLKVVYEVYPQAGGTLVAATAQWRRDAYGPSSNNAATPYSLDIGGSVKSGTRAFSAPGGAAIGPQWIESHSNFFSAGTATYITVTFNTGTQAAGNGAINTLTVPIASASKPSFSEVAGPAVVTLEAGKQYTIHTNRQSASYTHDVGFNFAGSASEIIANGVGASVNWTPPLSLLNRIPNALQGTGIVGINTFDGSTGVGYANSPYTLVVPASVVPTIAGVSAADHNAAVAAAVGLPVAGLSRLKLTVNAAGVYSSTITASEVSLDGTTVASGLEIPTAIAGNRPVTARATDSRGRAAAWSGTLQVLPYTPPSPSALQVRRSSTAGVPQDDGTFLRVDLTAAIASLMNGTERNQLTVRAFTRPSSGGPWTPRNVITPGGLTYGSWFLVSGGGIFSPTASYEVRVQIEDRFNAHVADVPVPTARVAISLSGTNVGIGKVHELGALDVAGDIYQSGQIVIDASDVATEAARGIVELATQAEVDAGSDLVRAVAPGRLRSASWLPYAAAAGRGTSSASGAVTVTLPVGKFTQPPRLSLTPLNHPNVITARVAADPTATSFQVQMFTMPGGALVAANFDWTAVQMTAGNASG